MKVKCFFLFLIPLFMLAQVELVMEGFYDDPSQETQYAFVQELLYAGGYVPEEISIYQTLPNHAHVYRVKLDSVTGGFMFIRWDKKKKEHYLANKMIDPGLYYNLKAARVIMRKQTDQVNFSVDDMSIQAIDQDKMTDSDLLELREDYDLKQSEVKKIEYEKKKESLQKAQRKVERKSKAKKN